MRIRRSIQGLLPIFVAVLFLASGSWCAQAAENGEAVEITLDFQDVELVDMISTISELTGKNFVYDESVRGKVSIISPRPVSIDEAYALFSTVLNVKGFTIVPSGEVNKIVPVRNAKEENLPVTEDRGFAEQYITRLIELKNLDARVVVDTILRPLVPKTSHVVAHEATNTVIITDSAANISRLVELLDKLDDSWEGETLEIVQLMFSDAEETADLVMQIIEGGSGGQAQVRGRAQQTTVRKITLGQVIPYVRTNKLLLIGDQAFIAHAKSIVGKLDEKADLVRSGVHVYYLEHAEAEALATTMNQILSGVSQKTGQGTPATPTLPGGNKIFGQVSITADKPTNALIISASAEDYDGVEQLISQLDIKRKQVFVEALIMELSMDALLELGASLQGAVEVNNDSITFGTSNLNTLGDGSIGLPSLTTTEAGAPSLLSQTINGILLGGLFNPITTIGPDGAETTIPALTALIHLAQTDTDVNVLSAPRLLTSNNEEAEIIVGSNVPIITSNSKDNDGNPINTVERKDVALTLRFTPQITEGDLVRLKIYQEISDLAPTNQSVGNVNEVGPTFNKRLLSNSVVVRDGRTVVLGGLFQTNRQQIKRKVPLLGDIPMLGWLFRSEKETEKKTSLLIFITPKVVRDSKDLDRLTRENRQSLNLFQNYEDETPGELFQVKPIDEQPAEGGD